MTLTPNFFQNLLEAIQRHLHPTLEALGFSAAESEPEWYGGSIAFTRDNLRLYFSYSIHDMGLLASLGAPGRDPIPDYHLYTRALGIPTEEFIEACGGWTPGVFKVPDLESALAFVARTLPQILPE